MMLKLFLIRDSTLVSLEVVWEETWRDTQLRGLVVNFLVFDAKISLSIGTFNLKTLQGFRQEKSDCLCWTFSFLDCFAHEVFHTFNVFLVGCRWWSVIVVTFGYLLRISFCFSGKVWLLTVKANSLRTEKQILSFQEKKDTVVDASSSFKANWKTEDSPEKWLSDCTDWLIASPYSLEISFTGAVIETLDNDESFVNAIHRISHWRNLCKNAITIICFSTWPCSPVSCLSLELKSVSLKWKETLDFWENDSCV